MKEKKRRTITHTRKILSCALLTASLGLTGAAFPLSPAAAVPVEAASLTAAENLVSVSVLHRHAGSPEKEGGCYTLPVCHVHEGSASSGGACFDKPVFHVHGGDTRNGGKCYGTPVYHVHEGDEAAGGDCYRTPVYHSHSGNAAEGGDCFGTPVYHVHSGNEAEGGACYTPVYHTHQESCYTGRECRTECENIASVTGTYSEYCYHHGQTQHLNIEGTFRHLDCGSSPTYGRASGCGTCRLFTGTHWYKELTCGRTEADLEGFQLSCAKPEGHVDSYAQTCPKDENTVDSYRLSCSRDTEKPESYALSCTKSGGDIDCYELSCGKPERTVERWNTGCGEEEGGCVGTLTVSNGTPGWRRGSTTLKAAFIPEKGGESVQNPQFVWRGEGMEEGKEAAVIRVTSNGSYEVCLNAAGSFLAPESLRAVIRVNNIDNTPPEIQASYTPAGDGKSGRISVSAQDRQPDGSPGSGCSGKAYSYDGGLTWTGENFYEARENGTVRVAARDACGNRTVKNVVVEHIGDSSDAGKPEDDGGDGPSEKPDQDDEQNRPGEESGEPGQPDGDDSGNPGGSDGGDSGNSGESDGGDSGNSGESDGDDSGNPGGSSGDNSENPGGSDGGDSGNSGESDGDDSGNPGGSSGDNSENPGGSNGGDSGNSGESNGGDSGNPSGTGDGSKELSGIGDNPAEQETLEKENAQMEPTEKQGAVGHRSGARAKAKGRVEDRKQDTETPEDKPLFPQENVRRSERVPEENKETVIVEQEAMDAGGLHEIALGQVSKGNFFSKPAVRAAIAAGGLVFFSLIGGFLYLVYRSVRVYNDDGEGRFCYLGSVLIGRQEDYFTVKLSPSLLEQSYTNRFCLRPGRLFARNHRRREMVVETEEDKKSVLISPRIKIRL